MSSPMQAPYLGKVCNHCKIGKYVETPQSGDWWTECNECNALLFCYTPMPHQAAFHADNHKYKMFAGGYGSAKTSTCAAELIKLVMNTPNGTSFVGAATLPQLEQTAKKDLLAMLHPSLIDKVNIQKNYIDLINGHRILFRPLDDSGKARSLNLCFIWVEEASEVSFDYIVQLQTRMRNHATRKHQMILSTNPDLGHVRSEFLLKADKIYGSEKNYYVPDEDKNPNISVHVASTKLNTYLPPDYYESTARGKEPWWVERYLNASFDYAAGAVYQTFADHIVEPFPIPQSWERLGGADFGIRDATVLLMAAIDPKDGTVYIHDEYYKNGMTVPEHAKNMREMIEKVPYGKLRALVGDPAGKRKGIVDMRSIFDHYAEYGLWFKDGDNRIDTGIAKVQAYFSLGRLKIFNTCANTIREGLNYKYKPEELDAKTNPDNKPIDKDNHACFVAGTLIETNKGLVPIDKVKLGDKVWTRQGYKRVYNSALTGVNKKVYRVEFTNGTHITATGNHPVFVENKGFLPIDSLRYSDIIKVSEHWEGLKCTNQTLILSNGTENSGEGILTPNILVTEGILKRRTSGFIGKCGNSIMEKSQKDIMYTIKTMIPQITKSKILKSLKLRNIWSTTRSSKTLTLSMLKNARNGLKKHKKKQLIGTKRKKVKNGIDNTLSLPLLSNLKKSKQRLVKTVITDLKLLMLNPSFAPTNVNQHGEENKGMTMYKEHALYAETNLLLTNTEKQKHVQGNVQVSAVIELETTHDVYNISVKDAHEYYANGVLVKNCDSLRYLIQELPDDPSKLIQKSYSARDFGGKLEDGHLPFALQTDDTPKGGHSAWLYY